MPQLNTKRHDWQPLIVNPVQRKGTQVKFGLEYPSRSVHHAPMKLIYAFAVWLIMAAILGAGLLWAVHGMPWLLVVGVFLFIVAVGKIGCLSH